MPVCSPVCHCLYVFIVNVVANRDGGAGRHYEDDDTGPKPSSMLHKGLRQGVVLAKRWVQADDKFITMRQTSYKQSNI